MPDDYEVETPAGQVVVLPADKARAMLAAGLARRIRPLGGAAWRVRTVRVPPVSANRVPAP